MAAALSLFALIFLYKQRATAATIFGFIAACFMLFALIAPKLLGPVETVWMGFARALGATNTRIIMGLIYFLIFIPLGLLFKALGRDEMRRRWASGAETNWEEYRPHQRNSRHYENMF